MIQRLRRRHLLLTTGLAVTLPAVLALALALRPPDPLRGEPGDAARAVAAGWVEIAAAGGTSLRLGDDRRSIELEVSRSPAAPDVLVYWTAAGADAASGWHLGALPPSGRRLFPLPAAAAAGGEVVLYSVAHGAEIGRAAPPEPPAPGHEP